MSYQLWADYREHHIIEELVKQKVPHQVKTLDFGDFQLIDREEQIVCVWERKTYNDLAASLSDKRFREQKHRMTTCKAPYKGYIIEGKCPQGKFHGLQPGAIDSIRLGLMCRDGFKVINSDGTRHTAVILAKTLKKIPEYLESQIQGRDLKSNVEDRYHCALVDSEISGVKKENLTPEMCYLAQLALIPQISYQSAKAIKVEYPNMTKLITAISDNRKQVVETISNIKVNQRRLGVIGEKVCNFMVPTKSVIVIKKKIGLEIDPSK
jgi:ERCC4-type nuclease